MFPHPTLADARVTFSRKREKDLCPVTLYVRFAPSPTGRIHIGNARTALINWIVAHKGGGRFVLRFDDTDEARSRAEYAESIVEDLAWLGIVPDLTLRQSDRVALYQASADCLKADGRLYACYETAEELERRRKRQQARGQPPIYDRAALDLTPEDHDRLRSEGCRPHWRFKLDRFPVSWIDGVRGPSRIDCASLSDPVLLREDGSFLYTLPSVVDDLDLGITDVIRGEDHVTNTAVQIQLAKALGGAAPRFAHHNLLTTADGEGLSKRSGALSLGGLRDAGIEPLAVAALAVMTGSSDAVHPVASLDALASGFELSHISRNPARFDPAELASLSVRTLHALPFEAVEARLAGLGIEGATAASFWSAVRGNLERFDDCIGWWHITRSNAEDPIAPAAEDPVLLDQALALLPPEPWDESTWSSWTSALKTATGRKGRALFHPLRLALTGRESGPELAALLPLIGRERAAARLDAKRSI